MPSEVFISYASSDGKDIALNLSESLSDNGISSFVATNSLKTGSDFYYEINEALMHCSFIISLLTNGACSSHWVKKELADAVVYNKKILPYKIGNFDDNLIPDSIKNIQYEQVQKIEDLNRKVVRVIKSLSTKRKKEPTNINKIISISWIDVEQSLMHIISDLEKLNWIPNQIIGIGSSGGIIASLLTQNTRWHPPITYTEIFNIVVDSTGVKERHKIYDSYINTTTVKGNKILLVDSIIFSGNTLQLVKDSILKRKKDCDIKTAILCAYAPGNIRQSRRIPEKEYNQFIIGHTITDPGIIHFPWKLSEIANDYVSKTVRNLTRDQRVKN